MHLRKLCLLVAVLALFLGVVSAQVDLGTIAGTVTDPTGAVIPGAKVTITSVNTGFTRNVITDPSGLYTITSLKPDVYQITVEAPGFAPYDGKMQVTVGSKNELSPRLNVASGGTTVEVQAGAAVGVETQTQELSQVVSDQQIRDMPTLNRDPYALVSMAGNVAHDPNEPIGSTRGVGYSINGQREAATNVQLDGAENSDMFTANVAQTIPLDAMQEFRVVTSSFGAEYGRTTAGVVNVSTKSGSNDFHGTLYEWNRVAALASNDYDSNARGLAKAGFTRNQFGYSVGGPIKKNKLFFFNTTEWLRIRSMINDSSLVPTPEFVALAGTCSGCSADGLATQQFFQKYGNLANPINGRVYTVGDLTGLIGANTRAMNPLFFGLTADTPVFGEVNQRIPSDSGGGIPQNTYNMLTRMDYNLSDKTTLYGRWALYHEVDFDGTNSNSPYQGFNTGYWATSNNVLLNLTHVFSPTLVSDSKFNFTRLNSAQPLTEFGVAPSLYWNGAAGQTINSTYLALPGYLPYNPGAAIPSGGPQNYGQLIQDFSWTKGKHQIKFGGMFLYTKDNHFFGAYQNAVEALSPSGLGGGLDNFLNGHLAQFQVAVAGQGKSPCLKNPNDNYNYIVTPECTLTLPVSEPSFARSNRYRDGAAYFTDSWKATNRLTINAGLRWEYYGVQHNNNGELDSNFYLGSGNNLFQQIANGTVQIAPNSPEGGLWAPKRRNFAPRFGFAWDVFGDGKTSLRGGFGMGYERNFNNITYNVIQNPPAQIGVAFQAGPDGTIVISPENLGQFATGTGTKLIPNASLRAVKQDIATARSYFWDFSVDREVAKETTASIAYTGSKGSHLYSLSNINRPGAGNLYLGLPTHLNTPYGDINDARLNQQFSNINYRSDDASSDYHAVNFSLRSNNLYNTGLGVVANYTWAHAIDNLSSTFTDGYANYNNMGFLDPFDPSLDRGSADFDIRHRLSASFIWDIPFAKSTKGVANRILDGWQVSTILTARTGAPYSVFDCSDWSPYSQVCPRATFSGVLPKGSVGELVDVNTFNYLNLDGALPGAYVDPVTGTGEFPTCTGMYGQGCAWPTNMSGRNSFAGPGAYNMDLGIMKNFRVTEGSRIQFRSEMFNAFNHSTTLLNLGGNNDVSMGNWITAYKEGRRRVQFAVKYIF